MTQIDALYRAFSELLKAVAEDRGTASFSNAFAKAKAADKITVRHNICHIEEDWIAAIERGLVFIGRAIGEDRQFIRSNGEVQPIEKVRHISRESVEHLSRHSDLITREQKPEEIVPDKLYTVERLNDYAVYENRFLYALLLRIKDFVSIRYDAVMRAYSMYGGELHSDKKITTGTRRFTYKLEIKDEQDDVFAAAADPACASALDRIGKIIQSVAFYLRTPLMVEVSRAPLLKKLTKTNVLRMDKNFREAVTLYEFLLDYNHDGYTIEPEIKSLDPVAAEIERELAMPAVLLSFLVYEHGLGVEDYLKEEYEKEEARREEARQRALVAQIEALKQRIAAAGQSPEEYMLLLEERNAALEKEKAGLLEELQAAQNEIQKLQDEIVVLHTEIEELHAKIEELNGKISSLEQEKKELVEKMERAEEEHRRKIEEMRKERAAAEAALRAEHAAAMKKAEAARKEEVAKLKGDYEARLKEERRKFAEKEGERKAVEAELKKTQGHLEGAMRECDMLTARITALRSEKGEFSAGDDFTTEEGFDELEREFELLGRLVRDKWTDTRKILKKEFYASIRATMKAKRPKKPKAYKKLREETLSRRSDTKKTEPEQPAEPESKPEQPETIQEVTQEPVVAQDPIQEPIQEVTQDPVTEETVTQETSEEEGVENPDGEEGSKP